MKIFQIALTILILVSFYFRATEIFSYSIDDIDTKTAVSAISGKYLPSDMLDIAHPGGLSVLITILSYVSSLGIEASIVWSYFILMCLFLNSTVIFTLLRREGVSLSNTLLSLLFYLSNPIVIDLSNRVEENFTYHGLLLLILYVFREFTRDLGSIRALTLATALTVLGTLVHLQVFLITGAAAGFYLLWSLLTKSVTIKQGLKLCVPHLASVLAILLVLSLFDRGMVNYHKQYYSIFSAYGYGYLGDYVKNFFVFFLHFFYTGSHSPGFTEDLLSYVAPSNYFLALAVCVLIAFCFSLFRIFRDSRFLLSLLIVSFGFISVYEPSSSERWDLVLLPLTLAFICSLSGDEAKMRVKNSAIYILYSTIILSSSYFNWFT